MAQWHALRARLEDCRTEAEQALHAGEAAAPDAAKRVAASLQRLATAVAALETRWAPAEAEPLFAELHAMMVALGDAVKARRGRREDVERAAMPQGERLRERLDALGPDSPEMQRIDGELARLADLASVAAVQSEALRIEKEIDGLFAAAAKAAPVSAQGGIIAALTKLGQSDEHTVDWDDPDFRALREAHLDEAILISGRFRKDLSSINLTVTLTRDGDADDAAAGIKVDIKCHDGDGMSCELVQELPRALYETREFLSARGEAKEDDGRVWKVVYNAETEQQAAGDAEEEERKRQERARTK